MTSKRDAWRWELDPRDPDYESPQLAEECDEEMPPELDVLDDDDPRNHGPMHYQPMRSDV